MGVLPALALPSRFGAATYMIAFAVGTLVGIGVFSSALGVFATRFGTGGARAYRYLMGSCAGAAVVIGSAWLLM